MSSYRSDFFTLNSSGDTTMALQMMVVVVVLTNGKIIGYANENREVTTLQEQVAVVVEHTLLVLFPEAVTASGSSALTITIGAGGAGVSNSLNRTIDVVSIG